MPERPSVINCAFGSPKEGKTWQFKIFLRRPSVPVREIQQNSMGPYNFCSTRQSPRDKKVSNPPLPQQRNFSRLEAERRSLRLAAAGGGGGGA